MLIEIVEVLLDGYNTTYRITAKDDNNIVWGHQRKVHEITDHIVETILDKDVFGWIYGVNEFGEDVKRCYMLVEE